MWKNAPYNCFYKFHITALAELQVHASWSTRGACRDVVPRDPIGIGCVQSKLIFPSKYKCIVKVKELTTEKA